MRFWTLQNQVRSQKTRLSIDHCVAKAEQIYKSSLKRFFEDSCIVATFHTYHFITNATKQWPDPFPQCAARICLYKRLYTLVLDWSFSHITILFFLLTGNIHNISYDAFIWQKRAKGWKVGGEAQEWYVYIQNAFCRQRRQIDNNWKAHEKPL